MASAPAADARARATGPGINRNAVVSWGSNNIGELGDGGPQLTRFTRPVQAIAAGSGIIQLAAGVNHALALRSNGTVLAWGNPPLVFE